MQRGGTNHSTFAKLVQMLKFLAKLMQMLKFLHPAVVEKRVEIGSHMLALGR